VSAKGVIVRCRDCGQKNRVPFGRLGRASDSGRCGKCRTELPEPGAPIPVDSEAMLDALLRETPIPVLVDWWSPTCGPCIAMAPALDEVARRRAGDFVVAKVNTAKLPRLANQARIRAVPTLSLHRDGREIGRSSGARPATQIEAFVDGT
jgi:thioredoxin 2